MVAITATQTPIRLITQRVVTVKRLPASRFAVTAVIGRVTVITAGAAGRVLTETLARVLTGMIIKR